MSERNQSWYLNQMGIDEWVLRKTALAIVEEKSAVLYPSAKDISTEKESGKEKQWESLTACVAACTSCALQKSRTQTVFGTGNRHAKLMIIGEAPGATEDRTGKPFTGRAGQLLDEMLHAIGFARDDVFIANVLKCRPPNNRDPLPEEVAACASFLQQQIDLLQPVLILALGRIAAHALLKNQTPLSALRRQTFSYGTSQTPLFVSYHPAYLLRSPKDKRKAYDDLQRVHDFLT